MNYLYIIVGFIIGINILVYLYKFIIKKINAPLEKKNALQKIELVKKKDEISILLKNSTKIKSELFEKKNEISELQKNILDLKNEIFYLKKGITEKDELFNKLKTLNHESITKITSLYSDFLLVQYDISSQFLKTKSHPAIKEAKRIEELKNESKIYFEQYRQMMYKYEMLLQLFPELSNYVDDFDTIKQIEDISNLSTLQEDYDRVQFYVSKEEYSSLSVNERNQVALDRYIKGQKSKWQIGRDYELYCGQLYEKDNWDVEYIGMEKKLNDLGRDLIAIKGNIHHVIQCKYWSKDKLIHEKHITQLYGTTIEYGMDMPQNITINPVFITNIKLSESANKFANRLGIIVKENIHLTDFPRIKCNVNRDEFGLESLIYHLPFDQQYDRTKINKINEFYAFTIEEAVRAGFRRAFRHYGY